MTVQVSVVVPTYNRPELLRNCLNALLRQDYPAEGYEVIVVDNAGSDSTRLVTEELARGPQTTEGRQDRNHGPGGRPAFFYLQAAGKPGPAAARNAGWRFAHGDIVAFTDDDCLPQPEWIREGVLAMGAGYDVVNGQVIVPMPARPTDYERNTSRLATAEFLTANCFIRCSALEDSGGFDERFETAWREDSDLQFIMLERGCKIGRAPLATVVHPVREASWGASLGEQRKSLYNALLFKKHPSLYRERIQRRLPWRSYAIIVCAISGLGAAFAGQDAPALTAGLLWALLTGTFVAERLRGTAHSLGHVAEMVVTSLLIPPLSVFWRLYGAVRYRVWFC